MKGRGGKTLILFLLLFLAAGFPQLVLAAGNGPFIYDEAGLLSEAGKERLEDLAAERSAEREIDFLILTVDNMDETEFYHFIGEFIDQKYPEKESIAILAMNMQTRDVDIRGYNKGEKYFDPTRRELVLEKVTPDLSAGNYERAFTIFIETSYEYTGVMPGVNPESIFLKWWFHIIISLVVAGVVVGLMAFHSGGRVTVNSGTYMNSATSRVINRSDNYLRKTVTKRRKPQNKSGGPGGGGGGGVTAGGHTFGSTRGKF